MKLLLKRIVSLINWIVVSVSNKKFDLRNSSLFMVRFKVDPNNDITFRSCQIQNSHIKIKGTQNKVFCEKSLLLHCNINISGIKNELILEQGVKLRNAEIHIRGTSSIIKIGKNTSTGGIRIVNVGDKNDIIIGEDCLFADHIEIWASDTHRIYKHSEIINGEKPIFINDKVWIGSHVTVLKGVTIGEGSVVGMRSLVTKDISPFTLNVGIPSKKINEKINWSLEY